MLWVVDGTRLKNDYPRFLRGKENFRLTNKKNYFIVDFPEKSFPAAWVDSSVPVIFDFKGIVNINYAYDWRYPLYYLFPKLNERQSMIAIISRESFIKCILKDELIKGKQDPEKQIASSQILKNIPSTPQRFSPFKYEGVRLPKRRRW
jgi:hypothetical protein